MTAMPGNGGARCCQGDAVRRLAEDYDADGAPRFHSASPPVVPGAFMLAHLSNGDGVYLNRATGCTIHPDTPARHRSMDGRGVARLTGTPARPRRVIPIGRRGRERTAGPAGD